MTQFSYSNNIRTCNLSFRFQLHYLHAHIKTKPNLFVLLTITGTPISPYFIYKFMVKMGYFQFLKATFSFQYISRKQILFQQHINLLNFKTNKKPNTN